ncbi:SRPBCC family protein [Jatrophihabitans endophyticus]|uniref:SRPBCC family protein n=1 Tax=Jatrophihabitans endophyticus TaxID=1206085 RepID=UPI001A0E7EEA|nr:SRPBCC family protein [Jatrophihabitans endophyticus]MBE7186804.1 SRPBCC family protein [Jatrophihabitans endophyticus]
MTIVTLHAAGRAAPDEAWERYADPGRWPQWAPQITRVETDEARLVTGMTGRVVGPLGVSVRFVVDEVDHVGRTWSWTVHAGPVQLLLHHAVRADPGGSATSLRVEGPLPVVLPYAPLARYALTRLVAA